MKVNSASITLVVAQFVCLGVGSVWAQDITNLIGYWPANEGRGDIVANAVNPDTNGTLMNAAWSADGEGHTGSGGDYAFEVTGDVASHVEVPQTDVEFEEITITAWIKGVPAGEWTGIVYARSAQPIGLDFNGGTGNITYTWNDNSGDTWGFQSDLHVPEDEWTFVAMSLKADGNTLYVGTTGDGGALNSVTNEIEHIPQTNDQAPFLFGVDQCCGDGRNFDGLMDDIAIWDVALSAEEIEGLWNGASTPLDVFDNSDPGVVITAKQDFGRLPFVATAQELRFPVRNSGSSQELTLTAMITEGENFSITSSPDSIAPGTVSEMILSFDPKSGTGQFISSLELTTNDPDAEDQMIVIELRASLVDPSGPIAHLPLDETAGAEETQDITGNGRSGMYLSSDGVLEWEQASLAAGSAIKVSGGAHVSIPQGLSGLESFTTSVWLNTAAAEFSVLFANGSEQTPGLAVLIANGNLQWFFDSMDVFSTDGAPLTPDTTHHVAVVYDSTAEGGAKASFYVDGIEVISQTVDPVDLSDSANILSFGGLAGNPGLSMNGVLDDIQIYDRALSAEEIGRLKDSPGTTLTTDGSVDSDQDGLADEDEVTRGTDPLVADSDGDGLNDGSEVNTYLTDPLSTDTDGDGFSDRGEIDRGADPLDANDTPEILTTAYAVPAETFGNQAFDGSLGHDFIVVRPIEVLELGVFDDGSEGMNLEIVAELWTRDDGGTPEDPDDDTEGALITTLTFTSGDPGLLEGGSRLKALPSLINLAPGAYTIVAHGYGDGEMNGNQNGADLSLTTDDGDGSLQFVGGGRFGDAGSWPANPDGGPANRYAAGTFKYRVSSGPVLSSDLRITAFAFDAAADGKVSITFSSEEGKAYEIQRSTKLQSFMRLQDAQGSAGGSTTVDDVATAGLDEGYFRVIEK
ncbi:MAG: hypothetical protein ACI8T1_000362 [Verrucomicrobiales bacterium]|jgi:hypothetical protein